MSNQKENEFIEILKYDKITRIEGLLIEELFYAQFLNSSLFSVSKDWWISRKENKEKDNLVKHVYDNVKDFDLEIANKLSSLYDIFFVKRNDCSNDYNWNNWIFSSVSYEKEDSIKSIEEKFLIKQRQLQPKNSLTKKVGENEAERLYKVIKIMNSHNIDMESIIESRILANVYGGQVMWDIDFFVKYNSSNYVFEVKQKYPTKKNTIGLNVGSYMTLRNLFESGFQVYNVILEKPKRERSVSTADQLLPNAKWFVHAFTSDSFVSNTNYSPEHTSYSQSYRLAYYEEDFNQFHPFANLKKGNSENLINVLVNQ